MQNTNSQDPLPEIGKKLAYKAKREGVEDHCPAPSVRKTIEVEVSLLDHYDQWRGAVELSLTRTAKTPDGQTFARLQAVPGSGQILARVILSEIQDSARFPRGQDFVSYCRLGNCAKEANGQRLGTSGKKSGTVPLRGAVAEAAVLF